MGRIIQHKRGLEKDLPTLRAGEFGITTDTNKIFVGTVSGNIDVTNKTTIDNLTSSLEETSQQLVDTYTITPHTVKNKNDWNNAINKLNDGGQLNIAHGDYYITEGSLKSNITIHGRGFPRIMSDSIIFVVNSGSSDVINNISNITFEYVTFESSNKTFLEWRHLLSLSGVSNITFRNCIFRGFRGDGVYLGSGGVGEERHNEDISFEKCIFDGVNHQNRNAISIIDGDGVSIEKCVFKDCTMPNMPGAIDIEPNIQSFPIVRNITVRKCKFKNIGGNTGAIGVHLPVSQSGLVNKVKNIVFEYNTIYSTKDTQSGIYVRQLSDTNITGETSDMFLKINNNEVMNCANFGTFITGVKEIIMKGNYFQNNKNPVVIGAETVGSKVMSGLIAENTFKKTATNGGNGGLLLYSVENLTLDKNTFDDCKDSALVFMNGESSYINLIKNTFISRGNTTIAIEKKSGHIFNPLTNTEVQTTTKGLSASFFEANKRDILYSFVTLYDTTKLPDSFNLGEEISPVASDANLPSSYKQGVLKTIRSSTNPLYRKFIIQWFYPANNDNTTLSETYCRKGISESNDWTAWKKYTGV